MTNRALFKEFVDVVKQASAKVEGKYFHLDVAHLDPVYRERAYAYELYHQLRLILSTHSSFSDLTLNGEVDKQGRRNFQAEKPDLLLHSPGDMNRNIAAVEIKSQDGKGIDKALGSLVRFTTEYGYAGGIFLIFGFDVTELSKLPANCIQLVHRAPGAAAQEE